MKRSFGQGVFLLVVIASQLSAGAVRGQGPDNVSPTWEFEQARQFDFWVGSWDVNLRMRQPDLSWKDSVKARANIYRILDGKAILELWNSTSIKGYSLRYFDRDTGKWVLYLNWPGPDRSGTSSLEGEFRHGRGEFFSSSVDASGNGTLSRYTFSDITPQSLRWDDAFSKDGGETWSANWIMEFTRVSDRAGWPREGWNAHTWEDGSRCTLEEFRTWETLVGTWKGTLTTRIEDKPVTTEATLTGYRVLDGCAVLNFLDSEIGGTPHRVFTLKTWNTYANVYEVTRLDNSPDTKVSLLYGARQGDSIELAERSEADPRTKYRWTLDRERAQSVVLVMGEGGAWKTAGGLELRKVN